MCGGIFIVFFNEISALYPRPFDNMTMASPKCRQCHTFSMQPNALI